MNDGAAARAVTVSRLSQYLKRLISGDPQLRDVSVRGEVANLRMPSGTRKQLYFSIKDEQAVLSCVVWPENTGKIQPLRDGARVVVNGSLDVYARGGQYQMNVRSAELDGEGALYLALEVLRKKLQDEGLFALEIKRELPRFPFHVALVSSATAQGAIDFCRVSSRRSPHIHVTLVETAVQGDGAGEQVAAAILSASRLQVDIIAVVRGGGASEDLWAFHHEAVVRAIRACPVPVITGIGHESDVTLADHAADVRAATPTDAATRLPALDDLERLVESFHHRLIARTRELTGKRREILASLGQRLERRSPMAQLADRRRRLGIAMQNLERISARLAERRQDQVQRLAERLQRVIQLVPERQRARLALAAAKLKGHDPEAILEFGYAIVRVDGKAIKDSAELLPGMTIQARLARGTVAARVESVEHDGSQIAT